MEEYIAEIRNYLPINYNSSENNEYVQYLIDACQETSSLNKDQFSLIAFHMLYMSYVFKIIWQSNRMNHNNIQNLLQNYYNKLGDYSNPFDLSVIAEKDSFNFLRCFGFHPNKISQFRLPVDNRDHCAHASGFIQYKKQDVERVVGEEINHIKAIHDKTKVLLEKLFHSYFTSYYKPDDVNSFFPSGLDSVDKFIQQHLLSVKDLESIANTNYHFLARESINRDIIYQKVFFLLIAAKYDELMGLPYDNFLTHLPQLLIGFSKQDQVSIDSLLQNELYEVIQNIDHELLNNILGLSQIKTL